MSILQICPLDLSDVATMDIVCTVQTVSAALGPDLQNIIRFIIRLFQVCRKTDLR